MEEYEETPTIKSLTSEVNDKSIAAVVEFHYGENAFNWLDKNIDALNGRTPRECLSTHDGINDLKEMLMKVPC